MSDSPTQRSGGGARRRRGRRGGRGRSRGSRSVPTPVAPGPEELSEATAVVTAPESAAPAEEFTAAEERRPISAPRESFSEATGSAISQAISQVSEIIETLKRTLEEMEEVLELTELAERQKLADEREIESLRRALRQLQRPRPERQRDEERPERHGRHERPARYSREDTPETGASAEPPTGVAD